MTQPQTITLEAFEATLRGTSILWYLSPTAIPQYPPGFSDQIVADAAPFAKKFLIISPNTPIGWRLIDDFDVVYRAGTSIDWSLLLTILTNSAKPSLVIAAPYVQLPSVFLQKLPQGGTVVSFKYMDSTTTTSPQIFQTILLPPLSLDLIPNISFTQTLGVQNPSWNVSTVLRDLHGAGASLVVSSLGDSKKQFYWYYTSKNPPSIWGLQQIQNILITLS